jgi:hypothetical protein
MYPKHEDHGMEQAGWDVQISFLGGICKLQYLGKPTEICQMLIRRQYLVKSQGSKLVMPRIGRFINGFEGKMTERPSVLYHHLHFIILYHNMFFPKMESQYLYIYIIFCIYILHYIILYDIIK